MTLLFFDTNNKCKIDSMLARFCQSVYAVTAERMEDCFDEGGSGLALYHVSDLIDCLGQ